MKDLGDHYETAAIQLILRSGLQVLQRNYRCKSGEIDIIASDGRTLSNKRVLIDAGAGTPDGFRVDVDGNLWCGWGMGDPALDGVMIFNPDGQPIGRIALPERCANVCFGGRANSRLFMAASQSVYALYVNVAGVTGG